MLLPWYGILQNCETKRKQILPLLSAWKLINCETSRKIRGWNCVTNNYRFILLSFCQILPSIFQHILSLRERVLWVCNIFITRFFFKFNWRIKIFNLGKGRMFTKKRGCNDTSLFRSIVFPIKSIFIHVNVRVLSRLVLPYLLQHSHFSIIYHCDTKLSFMFAFYWLNIYLMHASPSIPFFSSCLNIFLFHPILYFYHTKFTLILYLWMIDKEG